MRLTPVSVIESRRGRIKIGRCVDVRWAQKSSKLEAVCLAPKAVLQGIGGSRGRLVRLRVKGIVDVQLSQQSSELEAVRLAPEWRQQGQNGKVEGEKNC